MPTYEFRCPQGHEFEKFYRSIGGAEAQAVCPVCGQQAERMMSAAGFAFKGSGFYLTDYGKNAHREKGTEPRKPSTDGSSPSESTKSESGSSESGKPEGAKTESKSEGAKSADSSSGSAGPKPEPKPAEKKPAAAPKKSAGE
jgi:putative FmdB family regulatory protein